MGSLRSTGIGWTQCEGTCIKKARYCMQSGALTEDKGFLRTWAQNNKKRSASLR